MGNAIQKLTRSCETLWSLGVYSCVCSLSLKTEEQRNYGDDVFWPCTTFDGWERTEDELNSLTSVEKCMLVKLLYC